MAVLPRPSPTPAAAPLFSLSHLISPIHFESDG
jgi:hypothetical protein